MHFSLRNYLESWRYPTPQALPAIYGGSTLYMVVMHSVGCFPGKYIIGLYLFLAQRLIFTFAYTHIGKLYEKSHF